jgi:hypothetical protein
MLGCAFEPEAEPITSCLDSPPSPEQLSVRKLVLNASLDVLATYFAAVRSRRGFGLRGENSDSVVELFDVAAVHLDNLTSAGASRSAPCPSCTRIFIFSRAPGSLSAVRSIIQSPSPTPQLFAAVAVTQMRFLRAANESVFALSAEDAAIRHELEDLNRELRIVEVAILVFVSFFVFLPVRKARVRGRCEGKLTLLRALADCLHATPGYSRKARSALQSQGSSRSQGSRACRESRRSAARAESLPDFRSRGSSRT